MAKRLKFEKVGDRLVAWDGFVCRKKGCATARNIAARLVGELDQMKRNHKAERKDAERVREHLSATEAASASATREADACARERDDWRQLARRLERERDRLRAALLNEIAEHLRCSPSEVVDMPRAGGFNQVGGQRGSALEELYGTKFGYPPASCAQQDRGHRIARGDEQIDPEEVPF